MIQLSNIKEKLSWPLVLAIVLYAAAIVIVFAVWMPTSNRAGELELKVEQLERTGQNLQRILDEQPNLEAKKLALEGHLTALAQDIPSQYDWPRVQQVVAELSDYYELDLESLEHVPMKANGGSTYGLIPLKLRLKGNDELLSYALHLQESLPTLDIEYVVLGYLGAGQFELTLEAELNVRVLENASLSQWVYPILTERKGVRLPANSFGLPFSIVEKYLPHGVRVLGVVEAGPQSSVLLSKDGVQRWYKVGDKIGEAVVSSIFGNAVWLTVDGVQLKLTVGS